MMSEDFLAAVPPKSRPKFYFEKERPSFHTAWVKNARTSRPRACPAPATGFGQPRCLVVVVHADPRTNPGILAKEIRCAVQSRSPMRLPARSGSGARPAFLAGRIFDDRGNRMSSTHSNKRGVRYRYYVSHALLQNRKEAAPDTLLPLPSSRFSQLRSWHYSLRSMMVTRERRLVFSLNRKMLQGSISLRHDSAGTSGKSVGLESASVLLDLDRWRRQLLAGRAAGLLGHDGTKITFEAPAPSATNAR
jgi:hypothetical protein